MADEYAFVGIESSLLVLDVANPQNPELAGEYSTPGTVWSIDVADGYAYLANVNNGLLVLQLTIR